MSIFRHLLTIKETSVKSITVVYSTRSTGKSAPLAQSRPTALTLTSPRATELLKAFSIAISEAQASGKLPSNIRIDLHLHLTGSHSSTPSLCPSSSAEKAVDQPTLIVGRPSLGYFIAEAAIQEGTLAVAVCGPPEMGYDARKEVAEVQMGILRGSQGVRECWLHSEDFGW